MADRNRPPGTQVLIDNDYIEGLEDDIEEANKQVAIWKNCLKHTTDFLEILREQFDGFDELMSKVNDASESIEFVVDADDNIKYRINESQEG